jgi:hypothetical protein
MNIETSTPRLSSSLLLDNWRGLQHVHSKAMLVDWVTLHAQPTLEPIARPTAGHKRLRSLTK